MHTRRSRPLSTLAAALSAVLLGACSGTSPLSTDATPTTENILTSDSAGESDLRRAPIAAAPDQDPDPSTLATAPPETTVVQAETSSSPLSTTPEQECEHPRRHLIDTEFGRHLVMNRIPVAGTGDTFFSFEIKEDHFDPCAELSYLLLSGSLEGGDKMESLIFFHAGQLITQPAPFLSTPVEQVEKLDDHTLQVSHRGNNTSTSTHRVVNGQLESDLSQLPPQLRENPTLIDLTAPALTPDPNDSTIDQTLAAGRYRLPINDYQHLLCDIDQPEGPLVDCYADFPTTWKMNSNLRPQANRIIYTENPSYARGTADPALTHSQAEEYGAVQGGTTLQIGGALVDLNQPNQVTISTEQGGILITPDSYQVLSQ